MKKVSRPWIVGIVAAVLALAALLVWVRRDSGPEALNLAEFETKLNAGEVQDATIKDRDNTVTGTLSDGTEYKVTYPADYSDELTQQLLDHNVNADTDSQHESIWVTLLFQLLPVVLLIGVFLYFLSNMQGGGRLMGPVPGVRVAQSKRDSVLRQGPQPVPGGQIFGIWQTPEEVGHVGVVLRIGAAAALVRHCVIDVVGGLLPRVEHHLALRQRLAQLHVVANARAQAAA